MQNLNVILRSALVAACLLVVILVGRVLTSVEARDRYDAGLQNSAERAAEIVTKRVQAYQKVLRELEVVLTYAASTDASETEAFHTFVSGTDLFTEFPSLRSLALLELARTADLAALGEKLNGDPRRPRFGYGGFRPTELAQGPLHVIPTMIAPLNGRPIEIGRDLIDLDPSGTLQRASDTGAPTVSPRFSVFAGMPLLTMLHPYRPTRAAGRPSGFVAMALASDALMEELQVAILPYRLSLSVTDLGWSRSVDGSVDRAPLLEAAEGPGPTIERAFELGGRTWRLGLTARDAPPPLIGIDGMFALALITSLLAGLLHYRMQTASQLLSQEVSRRTFELERERHEALENAVHDDLTGMLNRRGLEQRFVQAFPRDAQPGPVMIQFDLDHFRQINDTQGHARGDALLRAFAELLDTIAPKEALIARVGGDAFTLVVAVAKAEAEALAHSILEWSRRPQMVNGREILFGLSAGLAARDDPSQTFDDLSVNCDVALSAAKDTGRNRLVVFDDAMRDRAVARKHLADDLRRGMAADEFFPFFQSQHDSATGALVGVEVLVRWIHPQKGVLPPIAFLDVAAATGVLAEIDKRVLEKSAEAVARMERAGAVIPSFSVNVSVGRLTDPRLLRSIDTLPPTRARLSFEMLESDFLDAPSSELMATLDALRARNIDLEVDDFGSGRASIIALTRLRPDRLKIDRELIAPLTEHPMHQKIVASIVEMGKALDIAITAEGVETAKHGTILNGLGVTTLQGFHFSRPEAEDDLLRRIERAAA